MALLVGGVVAVVSGIVGTFTVMRGQSYAGHALADISVTGGSGSFLIGISPLWGFAGTSVAAAGIMDLIGVRRPRGRDLATGIVRGAGLGLAALFLYWDTTHTSTTGATITILFGSMFTIDSSIIPVDRGVQPGGRGHRGRALPAAAAELGQLRPGRRARGPGAHRRRAVPGRDRARGLAVGPDHRGHPQHGAADRARGDRAAADQPGPAWS